MQITLKTVIQQDAYRTTSIFPYPPTQMYVCTSLPVPRSSPSPAQECLIARHDRRCGPGDPQTRNNKHAGAPKYLDTRHAMGFSFAACLLVEYVLDAVAAWVYT